MWRSCSRSRPRRGARRRSTSGSCWRPRTRGATPRASSRRGRTRCSPPASSTAGPAPGRPERINRALIRQERALTTRQGLPGRPWFRHQVYAPGLVTGYAVQYLPGMRDAVEQGDEETATEYRDLLLDSLREARRLAGRGAGA